MKLRKIALYYLTSLTIANAQLNEDFMARQDMVWDTLTGYFYDGIPTGNGLLGMVLHRQDSNRGTKNTNTLLFEINRTDLVDSCALQQEGYSWQRMAVGKFAITPRGKIKNTQFRLQLFNAQATGMILTDSGAAKVRFYTHAKNQVQVIEYEWQGKEALPKIEFLPDNAGCMLDFVTVDFQEKGRYASAKPPVISNTNGINTYHQPLNAGRSYTVAWTLDTQAQKVTVYHTIAYSHPVVARNFKVDNVLSKNKLRNPNFVNQHTTWWHHFYKKSAFVSLSDAKYENFYWAQLYKIGSTMRPNLQIMDLMGPWYAHTPWRGIWWNWNTQAIYYPLSQINHPELVNPLIKALHDNEKSLEENVDESLRNQGAIGIGRASSFDLRSKINMADGPPLYAGREPGNLLWVMHVYYQKLAMTSDTMAMKTAFFQLLKRAANLHLALVTKKDDGKYHLPLTMSPEYQPAYDCNYDLSVFRWSLKTLLNINRKFRLQDPLAPKWEEILVNLVAYPESKNGFMIGNGLELGESHRHFSHLLMFYPLNQLNLSNTDTALTAIRSVNHFTSIENGKGLAAWSHIVAAGMYAKLNDPIKAKASLDQSFYSFSASTLYREAGQCAETPVFWLKAFTDMLLKQQNDTIILFPAALTLWKNVRFDKIRIEGAFLVSARCEKEKILSTKISATTGGTLTLKKPSDLIPIVLTNVTVVTENKKFITLAFQPGGIAELSTSNTPAKYLEYSDSDYVKGNTFGKKMGTRK